MQLDVLSFFNLELKFQEKSCVGMMFAPVITLVVGWRKYASQEVVYAGLSLAFLYMTVLGFDSITIGEQAFDSLHGMQISCK